MKKLRILAAIAALAALFAACSLLAPKTSIDDCINNFMSALNSGNRSNLYTNLDSNSSQYNAAKTATYWDIVFATSGDPYTLSNRSTSGSTVTATITSPTNALYSSGASISFVMSTDGSGNAVIHSITVAGILLFY
jgi:hypothetical protein